MSLAEYRATARRWRALLALPEFEALRGAWRKRTATGRLPDGLALPPAATDADGKELEQVRPTPPALNIFDAGMGDGTVLSRLMRHAHSVHPAVPMVAVAKEISLEDVRLGLEKMPDRFTEHPATVLVITNLNYAEAPRLMLRDMQLAAALNRSGGRRVQSTRRSPLGAIDASAWGRSTTNSVR